MPLFALSAELTFPPPRFATREGLLAFGGDLSEERLLLAYRMGIFPWYSDGEPILWWSPDPRLVLYPREFHLSRSMLKTLKRGDFVLTLDTAFDRVIAECARVRRETGEGTWIVGDMRKAYCALHRSGFAHSVESWQDGVLAGGLYGVAIGRCFFGESMFARVSNASKAAFAGLVAFLVKAGFELVDCQVTTGHLQRMGAREISRKRYLQELEHALEGSSCAGSWALPEDALACFLAPKKPARRGERPNFSFEPVSSPLRPEPLNPEPFSFMDCPFCPIVRGEVDTEILLRNEHLVVFRDHRPQAPVHLLIVPVKHIRSINDIEPGDNSILGEMFQAAREMAAHLGIARDGYRLFVNVERGGGQVVFHLHMHLMAGRRG